MDPPPPPPPPPPPRTSPTKWERGIWGDDEDGKTKKILDKLLFGEYNSLAEMATDLNGSHKNELIERLLHNQMRKSLQE